jgi:hypothetical protein
MVWRNKFPLEWCLPQLLHQESAQVLGNYTWCIPQEWHEDFSILQKCEWHHKSRVHPLLKNQNQQQRHQHEEQHWNKLPRGLWIELLLVANVE